MTSKWVKLAKLAKLAQSAISCTYLYICVYQYPILYGTIYVYMAYCTSSPLLFHLVPFDGILWYFTTSGRHIAPILDHFHVILYLFLMSYLHVFYIISLTYTPPFLVPFPTSTVLLLYLFLYPFLLHNTIPTLCYSVTTISIAPKHPQKVVFWLFRGCQKRQKWHFLSKTCILEIGVFMFLAIFMMPLH